MKAEYEGIHPDEGTIHAWLDDALDAAEASQVALHVESCAECAGRVAEARGLIAGASRVVRLLDSDPAPMLAAPVVPATVTPISRWLRVTPARAAIAAALVVAVGLTLTREKAAVESAATFTDSAMSMTTPPASAPVADASAPQERSAPVQDSVLTSAITRRIREETPQRTIGNATGVAIPTAPPSVATAQSANTGAAQKVAAGRDSTRLAEVVVTGMAADKVQALARRSDAAANAGTGCYRLESRDGASTWVGLPLPAEIALSAVAAPGEANADGARRSLAITPAGGGAAIGSWRRTAGDTIALVVHSSFATTTGTLTGTGSTLSGTLQASARESFAPAAAPARAEARQRQSAGPGAATASTVRIAMRPIACPR